MIAIERVKQYCQAHHIPFDPIEGVPVIMLRIAGRQGLYIGGIEADDELNALTYCNRFPIQVPPGKQNRVGEILDQINSEIKWGNFQQNRETGTIFFRTGAVYGDMEVPDDIIHHVLGVNWHTIERYFTSIAQVILTECTPRQALEQLNTLPLTPVKKPTPESSCWGGRLGGLVDGSGN